ncbi:MAG TPA: hypothetical protein VKV17_06575 [Bryobacteraceae bacterium]|nr:hypothetical protein [Bryobacteraceae bacterium]
MISRERPEWLLRNGFTTIAAIIAAVVYALAGINLFYDYPVLHFAFLLASFYLVFFLKRAFTNDNVAFGFGVIVVVSITFLWDRPYPAKTHLAAMLSLSLSALLGTMISMIIAWLAFQWDRSGPAGRPDIPARERVFAPDSLADTEHFRFALKGCLAGFLCYFFDSSVAWPMIMGACAETCIVTSRPVSLPGSPGRKFFISVAALLLGGVILGMGSNALLLPLVDSITGFTVQFAIVSTLFAWLATSGPELSYAGTLGSMAYYFTMFTQFGLNPSLERSGSVVGDIFLALVVFWLVFDNGLHGGRTARYPAPQPETEGHAAQDDADKAVRAEAA